MKISIKKFHAKFNEIYSLLAENRHEIENYHEAVAAFDALLQENPIFVSEYVKYRGDFISSDLEAASFMFAYAECVEEEDDEDDF